MDRTKARGRTLSLESRIRIRDLLLAQLVWGMNLSVPDAVAVLNLGAITGRNARYRLDKCPSSVAEILTGLREETSDGAKGGLG